jgi:hypothetical protein
MAVWLALKFTLGLRLSADQEAEGADLSECGLSAYPEFVPDSARGSQIGGGAVRSHAAAAASAQMLPGRT